MLMALVLIGCFNEKENTYINGSKVNSRAFSATYKTMYLRGTNNGWGTTTPMTLTNNNEWTITNVKFGTTTTERFKFDTNGDWVTNFGDTNKDGIVEAGGADIAVQSGQTYTIVINETTKKYTLSKITIPTLTITNISATVKKDDSVFALPATGTYSKDGVSSQVNLSWTPALDTSKTGVTVYTATSSGLTVTFTLTVSNSFAYTYSTMNFRGTPNNWGSTPMNLVADYTWALDGVKTGATTGERCKFDVKGDWTVNFGLNGGIADIPLDANAIYNVVFNDKTKAYTFSKITVPTLTIPTTSAKIKKGDVFALPLAGTYTKDGVSQKVNLTWTPTLDTAKIGDTVYSATANGLTVMFNLNVSDVSAFTSTSVSYTHVTLPTIYSV